MVEQEIKLLREKHSVETIFFKNHSGIKGFFQFFFSIWNPFSARTVKKKMRSFDPDIVHLHNWHYGAGPLIIRAVKKFKKPILLTLHNYRLLCPSGTLLYKNKLFLKSLEERFPWTAVRSGVYRNSVLQTFILAVIVWFHTIIKTWHMVDGYICLSKSSLDIFINSKLGLEKSQFFVKPNFIAIDSTSTVIPRAPHFLYVGRLSEEKGIKMLLEVFQSIDSHLKIAGKGPLEALVKSIAKNHKNIEYLGVLDSEEVRVEMHKASALIFPSIWMETFGLTIIEAFASRCVVIASDLGAPKNIVTDGVNGFLFEAGNTEDLKRKIKTMLQLSTIQDQKIRENASLTFNKLYIPKKQFEYFDAIFQKLLD